MSRAPSAATATSTDRLHQDLARQHIDGLVFERSGTVVLPGGSELVVPILASINDEEQRAIGIAAPLTPNVPADAVLTELSEKSSIPVILIDELEIRRNLPQTTSRLLSSLR